MTTDIGGRRTGFDLQLAVPGRHNLLNALAAIGVAFRLDVAPGTVAAVLRRFTGVERRYSRRRVSGGIDIVDDYAHHPTEIEAVLETADSDRRIA